MTVAIPKKSEIREELEKVYRANLWDDIDLSEDSVLSQVIQTTIDAVTGYIKEYNTIKSTSSYLEECNNGKQKS